MAVASLENKECRLLIIKTDSYTGNFERELCAYATGADNDYAEDESFDFKSTFTDEVVSSIENCLEYRMSDRGFNTCVSIWNAVGNKEYLDIAIFFQESPGQQLLDIVVRRAKEYCENNKIKFLGAEWVEEKIKVKRKWITKWNENLIIGL